jgi:serine/threonine protein phosphatase PrpC
MVESRCATCGDPLLPGDRFCERCGTEVGPGAPTTGTCRSCGEETEIIDGYCSSCGMKQPSPRDHLEQSWPGVAAVTDKGRNHHRNEDAMAVVTGAGFVVAVVCDGASSSVDSDKASQAAADAAAAVLAASIPEDPTDVDFTGAFEAARKAVLAMPYDRSTALDPPTCTYLAAVATDDELRLAGLGDCRSYWIETGDDGPVARQLTTDDSWATEAVARGELPLDQAMAHPQGHAITRWISLDADAGWRPTLTRFTVPGPGRLVLCSDGLWNYTLEAGVLAAEVARGGDEPLAVASHLAAFANQSGGHDNITVVVIDLPLAPGESSSVDATEGDSSP